MGKHERGLIKKAEKIIVKILNSEEITDNDKKNRWFNHAYFIAENIKRDFPKIKSARHLGNRYDNTGDILIISDNKEIFIETKMSDTKLGVGTEANISQNALTENNLFVGKVISWSEFRKEKRHNNWVNKYLDQFNRYPQRILKIANSTTQKEEKARYLRDKDNKKAKNILNSIREKDRRKKLEYLIYLDSKKQQFKKIKRFFILITLGIHTKEAIADLMNNKNFFQEIQTLFVYYANYYKGKIIIRKEDAGKRIQKILKKYPNFKIIFSKKVTHCKIVGVSKKKKEIPLLQIVFHWKNIAQGIKTPCLNIFDLSKH